MELAPVSDLSDTPDGVGRPMRGAVHVEAVDEVSLSDDALRSRLKMLGRVESRVAAMKAQVVAEMGRRHSKGDAQRLVRNELQASNREAKRDVETATRLAELPTTSEALESGEIPVGHARLIARASSESPIDESTLVEAAGEQPFDEFARTVKRHQRDLATDDGQSLIDRQRSKRKARIFESSESGMFVLTAEFDQITGARIATALTAKERQLWSREDSKNRVTPQQRMADALAELICEPGSGRSAGADLLVIADYDVLKQQLDNPRLADGSPIPIVELHRLALEANLLPAIFDAKAQDMWLGRRQRTASEAQRIALIARDQGCIGCGANPLWCRAHHIMFWRDDGPTDFDNLALVCDDCHHKIHDDGWQVHKHPTTSKYHLKPTNRTPKPRTTPFAQHNSVTIPCGPAPPDPKPRSAGAPTGAAGAPASPARFAHDQAPTVSCGPAPPGAKPPGTGAPTAATRAPARVPGRVLCSKRGRPAAAAGVPVRPALFAQDQASTVSCGPAPPGANPPSAGDPTGAAGAPAARCRCGGAGSPGTDRAPHRTHEGPQERPSHPQRSADAGRPPSSSPRLRQRQRRRTLQSSDHPPRAASLNRIFATQPKSSPAGPLPTGWIGINTPNRPDESQQLERPAKNEHKTVGASRKSLN